jgi:aspartyl-tRNA(Asn)/glutamyl-tRNA(Gln) amidotransferase subunit A
VTARPLRIGIPEFGQLQPCDEDIFQAFIRSVEALRSGGHSVETFSLPMALSEYQALNGQIAACEAYRHHRVVVEDSDTPIDPYVRQRVLAGRATDDAGFVALRERLHEAVTDFRRQFGHFDIIASPSTPLPAIPVSEVDDTAIPMSRYTRLGNCLALCGISLPNGTTATGLPTGLQLMSWSGQDALLLAFAEQVSAL